VRIADLVYFAPGIRFEDVDLSSDELPNQFKSRMLGFYVDPAEECAGRGHAFAAGVILVCCIDALARLQYAGEVGKRIRKYLSENIQSFSVPHLSSRFYHDIRNGLVHEGRLKSGCQFSLEMNVTLSIEDDILIVNPLELSSEIRNAIDSYVERIMNDTSERRRFVRKLKLDHEYELGG
jgi:hypothetical protein